ncbi:MAG: glycosyltransferase family 2 protein [Verrucomicrobia bacterium]|nr:glycosyltransferase family 2 protein [Verrucomicrobiota bacterium]
MSLLPISIIIPTLDRRDRLLRTVSSLLAQDVLPVEIIVIDASASPIESDVFGERLQLCKAVPTIRCLPSQQRGAAAQRNQGFAVATQPFVLFMDDDVDLEAGCISTLWETLHSDPRIGGCGAGIVNQHYHPPGRAMRWAYQLMGCPGTGSLAGRCCGPALNFLPAIDSRPGDTVDWLNLCCTLYRREALPVPPLLPFFHGYSLMEDATLALEVGRHWRLAVPAHARLYHDSRPANYKDLPYGRERMEVINRWFVMRTVMGRNSLGWDMRQVFLQVFMLMLSLRTATGWRCFPAAVAGKLAGLGTVFFHSHKWLAYK